MIHNYTRAELQHDEWFLRYFEFFPARVEKIADVGRGSSLELAIKLRSVM